MIIKNKYWKHYSILSFARTFSENDVLQDVTEKLKNCKLLEIESQGKYFQFYYKFLSWDTNFFGKKTYRIQFVDYEESNYLALKNAVGLFLNSSFSENDHFFFEVPPEDSFLIQAFNEHGFRLTESRLIHYLNLDNHEILNAKSTRLSNENDGQQLGLTAETMVNHYDRTHADPTISNEIANSYLNTYAKACVEGFTDEVIVPDEAGTPTDSFIALNYPQFKVHKIAQIILTAVSSKTNKGWYIELLKNVINRGINKDCSYIVNTTQATNIAVIHSLEKLGFKLGKTTHLLVKS